MHAAETVVTVLLAMLRAARSSLRSCGELALQEARSLQQLVVRGRELKGPKLNRGDRTSWVTFVPVVGPHARDPQGLLHERHPSRHRGRRVLRHPPNHLTQRLTLREQTAPSQALCTSNGGG